MSFKEPYVVLSGWFSNKPLAFCDDYWLALAEQGLQREVNAIRAFNRALGDRNIPAGELSRLANASECAWERILEQFVPEKGYHLEFSEDDYALYAVPNRKEHTLMLDLQTLTEAQMEEFATTFYNCWRNELPDFPIDAVEGNPYPWGCPWHFETSIEVNGDGPEEWAVSWWEQNRDEIAALA